MLLLLFSLVLLLFFSNTDDIASHYVNDYYVDVYLFKEKKLHISQLLQANTYSILSEAYAGMQECIH